MISRAKIFSRKKDFFSYTLLIAGVISTWYGRVGIETVIGWVFQTLLLCADFFMSIVTGAAKSLASLLSLG